MIQIRLVLFGLAVVGVAGYAIYDYFKNRDQQQQQQQQHSYRSQNNSSGNAPSSNPKLKWRKPKIVSDCSICLTNIFEDSSFLICGHNFHTKCIKEWFNQKNYKCPNCRQPCDPKEIESFK